MLRPHDGLKAYALEQQKILRNYYSDLTKVVGDTAADLAVERLAAGHSAHHADSPPSREPISFRSYYDLLQEVQDTARIPGLGLVIGAMKVPANFGIYGYAMQSSETFGDLAGVAKRIFAAIYEGLELSVWIERGQLIFRYETVQPMANGYVPLMEQVVSTGVTLIGRLMPTGLRLDLCEARFAFGKPPYAGLYEEYLPCRLRFDQQCTELRVPEHWLGNPIESGNPLIAEICERQFKMMLDARGSETSIADRVRSLIQGCSDDIPTLAEVAERFCVSERTLRQHLADEGTSFRDLVNEARIERAKTYLVDSRLSAKEVAYRLGYSQPQSFSRAFSKLVGITPESFRHVTAGQA